MTDLYDLLARHDIEYERYDHPAVFTVEEAQRLVPELPGAKTKNLFLRDGKGRRHFLVVVPAQKRVDIKGLAKKTGAGRLSFASAQRLQKYLGVDPGSVTLLAVVNDPSHQVELLIDADTWQSEMFQFHPLVNTATLLIPKAALVKFLRVTGHHPDVIDVPAVEE